MTKRVKPMKKGTAEYLTHDPDREACIIAVRDAEGTPPYPLARRIEAIPAMLRMLGDAICYGCNERYAGLGRGCVSCKAPRELLASLKVG